MREASVRRFGGRGGSPCAHTGQKTVIVSKCQCPYALHGTNSTCLSLPSPQRVCRKRKRETRRDDARELLVDIFDLSIARIYDVAAERIRRRQRRALRERARQTEAESQRERTHTHTHTARERERERESTCSGARTSRRSLYLLRLICINDNGSKVMTRMFANVKIHVK